LKKAFWGFAMRHYSIRKPSLFAEVPAFMWFGFFVFVYGGALLKGWRPGSIIEVVVGMFLVGLPGTFGFLHCRIRIEAAKSRDALYRKWLQY